MATVRVTTCDRCGKTCSVFKTRKYTFLKYIWYGWLGCSSSVESNHDLCPDCAMDLDKFFEGKATDAVVKE